MEWTRRREGEKKREKYRAREISKMVKRREKKSLPESVISSSMQNSILAGEDVEHSVVYGKVLRGAELFFFSFF